MLPSSLSALTSWSRSCTRHVPPNFLAEPCLPLHVSPGFHPCRFLFPDLPPVSPQYPPSPPKISSRPHQQHPFHSPHGRRREADPSSAPHLLLRKPRHQARHLASHALDGLFSVKSHKTVTRKSPTRPPQRLLPPPSPLPPYGSSWYRLTVSTPCASYSLHAFDGTRQGTQTLRRMSSLKTRRGRHRQSVLSRRDTSLIVSLHMGAARMCALFIGGRVQHKRGTHTRTTANMCLLSTREHVKCKRSPQIWHTAAPAPVYGMQAPLLTVPVFFTTVTELL